MDKEILNMEEAADLFSVSIKTFIKLLKEEKIPARKIGREWRFSRKALVEWLSSGDSQTYSQSEGETKEFFDEVATEWERISSNYYDESIKNKLVESKLLNKSMTVVDLGAGDGYISRAVAKFVKKVIAVDISEEMLKELNKKARENSIKNIETVESDGQDMPIASGSIDLLCANMYLHHINEPEHAIKEINRVVKPGGTVFIADFYQHTDLELKEKMHDIWPGFDPHIVKAWFLENDFKNISIYKLSAKSNKSKNQNSGNNISIFVLTAEKI